MAEKNETIFVIMVLLCFAAAAGRAAETIYVDAASPNDPGSGTSEDPFRRIQDGIDYSVSGDSVVIHRGVYTGSGNYDLDPNGKAITIRSTNPEDEWVVANTVIDPNLAGRGFYIHNGEDANCLISGLTIKKAYTYNDEGAGIYCNQSNPTIKNCILTNNYSESGYGGAVFCAESNSLFENCTISGNYAYDGGGIEIRFGYPILTNCIIRNNHADRYGGGVDCYSQGNPHIVNCIITNNSASDSGGGMSIYVGYPHLINCIISNNYAGSYSGAVDCFLSDVNIINCNLIGNTIKPYGLGSAISLLGSSINIKNSILWANDANTGGQLYLSGSSISISYSDVEGGTSAIEHDSGSTVNWGSGNIDTDPCFASFDPNGDPNLWDFHLQSTAGRWNLTFYKIDRNKDGIINLVEFARLAGAWLEQGNIPEDIDNSGMTDWGDLELFAQYYLANSYKDGWISDANTSPCIDAGDPNSDWSAEPWPNGERINIGAYGGTGQASKNGNIADFNTDGKVDFADFALFAGLWNKTPAGIEDLTKDGIVDLIDLKIFTDKWLWGC